MPDNDFTPALAEGMAAARRQRETYTDAWAVEMDGTFFSLWLNEAAAKNALVSYRRGSSADWRVVPIKIARS